MVPAYDLPGAISFKQALSEGSSQKLVTPALNHDDIAFLQYTGGTTGVSKGAMLLHRNIIAALMQYEAWLGPAIGEQRAVIITALPLYHIFSLTVNCLVMMVVGGENILITNPRDIPGFIKELGKHKYSIITGVNTLFNALLNHPDFAKLDFSSLKLAVGGGMAVQKAVADRWKQVTGTTLIEGYGLTETAPSLTSARMATSVRPGSVGLPLPEVELRIVDDAGEDVEVGDPGEILVRGPNVFKGYWNREEDTEAAFVDGWFCTGDIGLRDEDGHIYLVDRKRDLIIVSGFNVFPSEVEHALLENPKIAKAAVVGVPHAYTGEAVKAYVVLAPGVDASAAEIITELQERLARFKRPGEVEIVEDLPHALTGKVLRRVLRT
jgi:long-chain acyl-CoA synthetase